MTCSPELPISLSDTLSLSLTVTVTVSFSGHFSRSFSTQLVNYAYVDVHSRVKLFLWAFSGPPTISRSHSLSLAVSTYVYLLCYGRCNEPSKLAFNPLLSQLCWPLRAKCKLQTEFCLRLLWLFMKPIVDRVKIYFYGHFYTHRNVQEMHRKCGKKWATIELGYKPH